MKTFELLDVCYPDYFSGYNRPVIAIPVFNNMVYSEIAKNIKSELNATWEYLTNESNGFSKTEILIIEEYIEKLKKKGMEIFFGNEFEENENDDCFGGPYAYFSICKMVYSNGIRFLN